MASPVVLLPTTGSSLSVRIHPVALFAICDAYIRRSEKQDRVIGTLLGVIADNVVEVKNCYVVPHNESSEQVLDNGWRLSWGSSSAFAAYCCS